MQLKAVVFPEPFGPMSPRISPSLTPKATALSAVKPPKRFVSPLTERIIGPQTGRTPGAAGPAGRAPRASGRPARTSPPWFGKPGGDGRGFGPGSRVRGGKKLPQNP